MSTTLSEVLNTLKEFSLNDQHGQLVFPLVEKIEKFVVVHPELLYGKAYTDTGYDPETQSAWNDLMVEDDNGYSSIVVEFDEDSIIYAHSGYDPELQLHWDELILGLDGENITLIDFEK